MPQFWNPANGIDIFSVLMSASASIAYICNGVVLRTNRHPFIGGLVLVRAAKRNIDLAAVACESYVDAETAYVSRLHEYTESQLFMRLCVCAYE